MYVVQVLPQSSAWLCCGSVRQFLDPLAEHAHNGDAALWNVLDAVGLGATIRQTLHRSSSSGDSGGGGSTISVK